MKKMNVVGTVAASLLAVAASLLTGCGLFQDRLGIAWQIKNETPIACTSATLYFYGANDAIIYGASTNIDKRVGLEVGPSLDTKGLSLDSKTWHAPSEILYAVAQCNAPFDSEHPSATRFASSEHTLPVIENGSMWFHVSINKTDAKPVVSDRDMDGTPDSLDLCPDMAAGAHPDTMKPGCPAKPTGDCKAFALGTRDATFPHIVCANIPGDQIEITDANTIANLEKLPRAWVDTSVNPLPAVVRLNTFDQAVSVDVAQYDSAGKQIASRPFLAPAWYVLHKGVAVIKSGMPLNFMQVQIDMNGKPFEALCATSTIVTGADTCQPGL